MAWNFGQPPNGHAWPQSGKYIQVHYEDEAVAFDLLGPYQSSVDATAYEVRDYWGQVVRSGVHSGTTINLGILPLGWYKIYFRRPSMVDSTQWRDAGGDAMFVVVRRSIELPSRPALGAPNGADPLGEGVRYPIRGFMRIGPWRKSADPHATNFEAQLSGAVSDAALETASWGSSDPVRPLTQFANFPHAPTVDGVVTNPALSHPTQMGDAVSQLAAAGVHIFEGFNEPNNYGYSNSTPEGWAQWTADLRAVVKAADPAAKIAGPCSISIVDRQLTWMRDALVAAGDNVDVVTFHAYNAVNGDLAAGRRTYGAMKQMLASIGMSHKPLLNSEGGSYFATNYGSFVPRQQTQRAMLEFHILEQMGIPKERFCYFYDTSHGFWSYPSWWVSAGGWHSTTIFNPHPLVAVMRVWSEELRGKTVAEALDFGTLDNDHFIGTRCESPDTGESVVILQSGGRVGCVTFALTGAPGGAPLIGTFGESLRQLSPDENGQVCIEVGMEPIYVRLPAGGRLVPEAVSSGVDVAHGWRGVPTASASGSTINGKFYPLSAVNNGILDNTYNSNTNPFLSEEVASGPAWVRVDFPRTARIDRIVIDCPEPWQHGGSFLDFDVQVLQGGAWVTVDSRVVEHDEFEWSSVQWSGACYYDTYWSREHIFVTELDRPVDTDAIRVYARDMSAGGEINRAAQEAGGLGLGGGQGGTRKLSIREMSAYLTSRRGGGVSASHAGPFLIT